MTARLPTPGQDDGTWGSILNEFLGVSLNSDGTMQSSAVQQAGATMSVNGKIPSSGGVTLAASDVGAVSQSGGTVSGNLTVNGLLDTANNVLDDGNSNAEILGTLSVGGGPDPGNWAGLYSHHGFRSDDDFRFQKGSGAQYIARLNGSGSGGQSGYDLVFQAHSDQLTLFGAGGVVVNNSAASGNYFQVNGGTNTNSFSVSTTGAVSTSNNTLDDGTGNATIAGSLSAANIMTRVSTTGTSGYALTGGTGTILSWTAPNDGDLHSLQIYTLMRVISATTGGDLQLSFTDPSGVTKNTDWLYANRSLDDYSSDYPQWLHTILQPGGTITLTQNTGLTGGAATIWAEFWSG